MPVCCFSLIFINYIYIYIYIYIYAGRKLIAPGPRLMCWIHMTVCVCCPRQSCTLHSQSKSTPQHHHCSVEEMLEILETVERPDTSAMSAIARLATLYTVPSGPACVKCLGLTEKFPNPAAAEEEEEARAWKVKCTQVEHFTDCRLAQAKRFLPLYGSGAGIAQWLEC